jgi:hypothetical protein
VAKPLNFHKLFRLSGTINEEWDDQEKENAAAEGREPLDEPSYTFFGQFARYLLSFYSAIDLISIIPTYVTLGGGHSSTQGLSSLRVLRLLRAIKVMKISIRGRMMVSLLSRTMKSSQEAFAILLFYLSLVVIFFASIIYAVESGEYTVNDDYPGGAYLRPNGYGGITNTPFRSIPTAMYYMIVTLTTVGYGDMFPTTIPGRALASLCCILGVLSLSLPISVISNNFTMEYQRYLQKKEEYYAVEKAKKVKVKRALENMRRKRASGVSVTHEHEGGRDSIVSMNDDSQEHEHDDHIPFSDVKRMSSRKLVDDHGDSGKSNDSSHDKTDTNDTSPLSIDQSDAMHKVNSKRNLAALKGKDKSFSRSISKLTILERILAMSDDSVNSLDLESLQALFHELRDSAQQLHYHNMKISSLASDLGSLADKLQRKSIFLPIADEAYDHDDTATHA